MKVHILGCSSHKRGVQCHAQHLYLGDLFIKSKRYTDLSRPDAWYILSALHGLLKPDDLVAPYDVTLNNMRRSELRYWGQSAGAKLMSELPRGTTLVFLCGSNYRDDIIDFCGSYFSYEVPMKGLGIGQQKRWLKEQNALLFQQEQ